MTKQEFFDKIRQDFRDKNKYLIELLKLRGFVIDMVKGEPYLIDNSDKDDSRYLRELLAESESGSIENNRIMLSAAADIGFFENLFEDNPPILGTAEGSHIKHRIHGEKVPVVLLDPFVARYVKAISACSVKTEASCDGNHPLMDKIVLMITDRTSRNWHRLICQMCLVNIFDLRWNNDFTAIEFDNQTKYHTYYELNRAAKYFYAHRQEIRGILNSALREIAPSYFRDHSPEEIEMAFNDNAVRLFYQSTLLLVDNY